MNGFCLILSDVKEGEENFHKGLTIRQMLIIVDPFNLLINRFYEIQASLNQLFYLDIFCC